MSHELDSAPTDGSLTAHQDGTILQLTIDRPLRRNTLSQKMIETFTAALTRAASDARQSEGEH